LSLPSKILILNYEYPPLGGGAGIVTKHLSEQFLQKGFQVQIVTTWFSGEPEFSSEGNLTIVRLKSQRKVTYKSNPLEMLSWARHALNYFKQLPDNKQFDVCIANFTMPGGIVAKYIEKRWNIPFVILSHGHDIPWFAPKQMLPWHILAYPWIKSILKLSSKNIVLNEELKNTADQFMGVKNQSKNIVIPNGMLMDKFKSGFDKSKKSINILFVGRLVEQKDPISFIKACKYINDLNIPVHYTMIGDGPLKSQVEKLVMELDIRNIEIMGQVSHYEVLKAYENTDILILPSREEAMSLVILESVSRGIYVITTDASANGRLIEEGVNGSFVPYGQPKNISQTVADFYYNKYLTNYQYPQDLILRLIDKYSWDKVADQYLKILHEISNLKSSVNSFSD
jgi:glycosyltransferase involved in cell wall biosynthesis